MEGKKKKRNKVREKGIAMRGRDDVNNIADDDNWEED